MASAAMAEGLISSGQGGENLVSGRLRLVIGALALAVLMLGTGPAGATHSTELFFSEYIEGTSNNKALEISNGTGAAVNLSTGSYSVQMFFNGSSSAGLTINLTGSVAAGDVYVLAQSSANATILAQADQTNGAGWFNGDDAVVLRKGPTIVDVIGQIGFDPGTEWGSGLTSTQDNTLRRKSCIAAGDTNGANAFDPAPEWDGFATDTFDGLGAHVHAEGDCAPFVASTSPAGGATNVPVGSNITISFNEPVNVTGSWFDISCPVSGEHSAAESGGPTTYTLNPDADFALGETCTVTVFAANVSDQDADDPPDAMTADQSFTFTTAPLAATIQDIQGAAHISPLNGRAVKDVEGIVTARRTQTSGRGFWFQDAAGDGDLATSDAVFVFTGSTTPTAQIGDKVRVAGTVSEFRPGGDPDNLTITQIGSPTVQILPPAGPVAPTVLGVGGRIPPTETIDDDSETTRSVEVSNDFDPADDAIDFYESLEGMLLQVNAADVVGPTKSFGEITLLPDSGAWATGLRTPRGGILYSSYADGNPERIAVDDEILRDQIVPRPSKAMPDMDVGAVLTSNVVGPLDYSFSNYKIQATSTPSFIPSTITRETATPPLDQELAVATFNVENLSPNDSQAKFDELASMIVDNLRAPDLIGIEEVQDNSGFTDNGVTDASETWARLIAAIQAAGGPLYEHRQIDPLNNQDGGAPGGNIRVGFLFRTDRGLSFTDRSGGDATTPATVVATPAGPRLSLSPGRIDPNNPAYLETRKSLAGEFRFRGKKLFAVVVHFSSKGDDQPLFGPNQPPTRFTEGPRHGQAQAVADFVSEIAAVDPNAYVVMLGDINDFQFSETVDILEGGGLTTFVNTLPENEQYSYVFEGNSQVLDQILGSDPVLARLVEYDVVHVNAEFAVQASDHEPSVARVNMIGQP
jgi:predicted extracellular nuclease